ncbi:MAG TPA: hypothetical protein VN445_13920 [Rectinemataceae bacterium]|nr:hypothetical protein [Rectinemataceae bacterium]
MGMKTAMALLSFIVLTGCRTAEGGGAWLAGAVDLSPEARRPIVWETAFTRGGLAIAPGNLRADFGRFDFFWSVSANDGAKLMTSEPRGSSELGLRDVELYPYFADNGSAVIFRQWAPLLNSGKPYALRVIAVVSAEELSAGLARAEALLDGAK